ncbi:MAG TPA: hypothetical protein VG204_10690 [Terriglobia bacterium]|nr:hypothetical protein [Terriglobia bacterium]
MNKYTAALLLALAVVLASSTLRKSFASVGGSESQSSIVAIGGSPMPTGKLAPSVSIGGSPMPTGKLAPSVSIGGSPMPTGKLDASGTTAR